MGITIVNKTIVPINIVVMQLALTSPVGYGRHMNIKPGARVNLDIGEVTIKQFRVYCWVGGTPGTEISADTIENYIAARTGITLLTFGLHDAIHGLVEGAVFDACQEFIMGHLAH